VALPERSEIDELAARWIAAWIGERDFDACCSVDVTYEDPLSPQPRRGLDDLRAHALRLREAFPDVRVEPSAPPLHRGDNACFAWRLAGTHRGEIALLPATDRFVTLHGVHYVELVDGRIARARGFFDLYDGATQLGLLPARGGLAETALMVLRGFGLRR
jgi:steroid delta-isomerase-like uncharacterized protein